MGGVLALFMEHYVCYSRVLCEDVMWACDEMGHRVTMCCICDGHLDEPFR